MTTRTSKHTYSRKDDDAHPAPSNAVDDSSVGASSAMVSGIDATEQWRRIAEAAYYRAQERGFCPGCEMEDWLAAEREVGKQPSGGRGGRVAPATNIE